MDIRFTRHVDACNNAVLPGARRAFHIGTAPVGWVGAALAGVLAIHPRVTTTPDALVLHEAAGLTGLVQRAVDGGFCRARGEMFAVRGEPDGPVLAQIDRGALPAFGILAEGVHVNGLVQRSDGLHLWVARRAATKKLDPGKLDHIVAGGISAGMDAAGTVLKEAAEEAGIAPELARTARFVGTIRYAMDRPEGLRRDRLSCYDVDLPEDFVPHPADGEVAGFELWPIERAIEAVRDTDDFKFNVNLVLIDLFRRRGLIGL